jgi:hypothetical protein
MSSRHCCLQLVVRLEHNVKLPYGDFRNQRSLVLQISYSVETTFFCALCCLDYMILCALSHYDSRFWCGGCLDFWKYDAFIDLAVELLEEKRYDRKVL